MADVAATGSLFPSYFWGGDKNVNQQLRQRIALQMMANKRAYPKNIGEGLSAIGDAIGERGLARMLEQQDVAAQGITPPAAAPSATPGPQASLAVDGSPSTTLAPPDTSDRPAPTVAASPADIRNQADYNEIDASANFKRPTPGYMQDAIARNEPNPDMRAYYGALSSGEAKGPNDVSPTGAAGPFQFVPGTGRQYGLNGPGFDNRADLDASTQAAQALTRDNIAAFNKVNGRDPTFAELALMHQQGGVTGANMVAGTGNASPLNLQRNNIAPDSSPAQAVAGINKYYGMPNAPIPPGTGSRDSIAAAMTDRQTPLQPALGPAERPADARVADATGTSTGPAAASSYAPAREPQQLTLARPPAAQAMPQTMPGATPPLPSTLTAFSAGSPPEAAANRPIVMPGLAPRPAQAPAPGAQLAQAVPGYVPPQPADPAGAPIIGMTPREVQLRNWLAANQGNPYAAMKVAPELGQLETERTTRQAEASKLYEAKVAQQTEQAKLRQQGLMDQAKREADVAKTAAETRKANIVENPEEKYMMGADGVVRPIRVEGEDPNTMPSGKLTEDQRKTLVYHGWAKSGNQAVTGNDQLLANGLQQEMLGKIPFAGNAAQNDAYRRAKNGADNFILAFMRSTSGAQYGATERLDHAKAMLPRYGDDAKTLSDKAGQRQQFIDTEYAGLGRQGQKMADFLAKSYDPASGENRQRLIDIEMQGVKGSQVGEVKTNRKTGQQRFWNGSRWIEGN